MWTDVVFSDQGESDEDQDPGEDEDQPLNQTKLSERDELDIVMGVGAMHALYGISLTQSYAFPQSALRQAQKLMVMSRLKSRSGRRPQKNPGGAWLRGSYSRCMKQQTPMK